MIRLWQLGDRDKGMLPSESAVEKLTKFIKADKNGVTVDIVWDDLLKLTIITDDGKILMNHAGI